jgi:hypothetical protein
MDKFEELESAINSLMNRLEIVERFLSKEAQGPQPKLVYPFSDPPNASIKFLSVHHSASRADVSREDVLSWHANNGWPAEHSGYHVFIQATGEIEWGDMDATLKYIVGHQNPHTLGVCLAGNFHPSDRGYTGHPTPSQLESLKSVLAVWKSRYPKAAVVPHKFFGGTVCPGDILAAWLEDNYVS